jgi:hypothetical protein
MPDQSRVMPNAKKHFIMKPTLQYLIIALTIGCATAPQAMIPRGKSNPRVALPPPFLSTVTNCR